ncbi:YceI family protein [Chryseobacterium polytrichastri]|uniref:YceI-like domain-containing protein n=1 Tax=Chryseobacterium polytrichastri TaxID=1302687 RepID=A0A1M6TNK8_9FLAO|nr:YceI family protein [Chryseobacterium polytrichastri]SHK58378.1 YceI-like domain-containing protein [Chryseobacterium polytrichastri]
MKKIIIATLIFMVNLTFAQKYLSKEGKVSFEASVPLFEDVYALDKTNVAVLNTDTGELATLSVVKNFKFKVKLMEEHFNESYAESEKYPKTSFKGKIQNFDKNKLSATPQKYTVNGILNFHGVNKEVSSIANIYTKDGKILMQGAFSVKPVDYKVTVPKMVTKKVAENVKIKYDYILTKQ